MTCLREKQWYSNALNNKRENPNDYDIVIGPVANDQTILTINLYMEVYGGTVGQGSCYCGTASATSQRPIYLPD